MSYTTEAPKVTKTPHDLGEIIQHPAFGMISVSRPSSGGKGTELFGSALNHNNYVSIKIETAELHRDLNRDWVSPRKIVTEFEMSHAQWAQFVASSGMGQGTPVTLRYRPEDNAKLVCVPGIESNEKLKQTFEREIKEQCARYIADAKTLTKKLADLIESGKTGKTQLKELHHEMSTFSGNFAANMAYVQNSFAEAMENSVEAGKSDIEAFVSNLAQSTGLAFLKQNPPTTLAIDNDDSIRTIED